ncbi:MAG: adenylosuccinate synthase [Epulopiscium sp. Nele67-Bin004]|nr:MAG: adenylosuccinate synthase [Epulopiscium sp. Nele67-Bin004]
MVSAIVGGNWGDEGKGKITDLMAGDADIIVRFQGGANAGHTIINEYGKFALHLLPSGVFRKGVTNVIGQGVAVNLEQLFKELDGLLDRGVPMPNILVSDRAQVVMPYHVLFDKLEEERLGKDSFGSTKSGIAPFYSDKYLKIGVQVSEMFDDETLIARLKRVCETKNETIKSLYGGQVTLEPNQLFNELVAYRERLKPMVTNIAYFLHDAIKEDKNILLEGQLGALKDTDNGIYPFVTSSSPLAGFATVGASVPPHAIKKVVTVVKAYSSAVGAGAFVSEIFDDEAHELRMRGGDGGEFGATTGRARRMGWFDCVASKYGCMLQGTTDVAFSLIDVLGYLDKIPVCVGYEIDGEVTTVFPNTIELNRAKPVLEYVDGWKCDLQGIRKYEDLPKEAQNYVEFVEKHLGFPITMISNGPKRDDIIIR